MSSSNKNLIKIKSDINDTSSRTKKGSDHSSEKVAQKATVSSINQKNLVHIHLSDDCDPYNTKHGKSSDKNKPQIVDKVKIQSIIQQPCFKAIWNDKDNILKTVSQTKNKTVNETKKERSNDDKAFCHRSSSDRRRRSPTYSRKSYSRSQDRNLTHHYTENKTYDKSQHHKHFHNRRRTIRSLSHLKRRCSSPIYNKQISHNKINKHLEESTKKATKSTKHTKSNNLHDRKREQPPIQKEEQPPIQKEEQSSSKLLSESANSFTSHSIEDDFQENNLSLESSSNVSPVKSNSDDKCVATNLPELGSPFVKKLAETVRTMLMNKTSLSGESNSLPLSESLTNSEKQKQTDTKFCIKFDIDWPEMDKNTVDEIQPSTPSSSESLYSACEEDDSENELGDEVSGKVSQMPTFSGEPGSVIHDRTRKILPHAETERDAFVGKKKCNDIGPTKAKNDPYCMLGFWFPPNRLDWPIVRPAEELCAPVCKTCNFANSHLDGVIDPRLQSSTYLAVLRLVPRCCICFKCLKDEKYGLSHIPQNVLKPKIIVGVQADGIGETEQLSSDAASSAFQGRCSDDSATPPAQTTEKYDNVKVCTIKSCVSDVAKILPGPSLNFTLPVKKRKTIFASNLDLNKSDASTVVLRPTKTENVKDFPEEKSENPLSSNESILKPRVPVQTAIEPQNSKLVKGAIRNISMEDEASSARNGDKLQVQVSESPPSFANRHPPDNIMPTIEKNTNESSSDDSLRNKKQIWSSTSLDDSDVSSDLLDTSSSCVHSTPTRTETIIVESSSDLAPEPIGLFDLFQLKPASENISPNDDVHIDRMPETCGSTMETSDDQTNSIFDHLRKTFDLPHEPQPPILIPNSNAQITAEDDSNVSTDSSEAGPRLGCKRRPAPLLYSDLSDDNEGPVCAKVSSLPSGGPSTFIIESIPRSNCSEICSDKPREIAVFSPILHSSFDFSSPRNLQIVEESDCDQLHQDKATVSISLKKEACTGLAKVPREPTGESLKNKTLVDRTVLADLESESSSSAVETPKAVTASVEQNVSDNSSQDWSNPDWLEDQLPSLSRNRRKRKPTVPPLFSKTVSGLVQNSQPNALDQLTPNSDPPTPAAESQNKEIPFKKRKFSNAVLTESSTDETGQKIDDSNFNRISPDNTACSEGGGKEDFTQTNNSREIICHDMESNSGNFGLSDKSKDTFSFVEETEVGENGVNEEDCQQPLSCVGNQSKELFDDSELSETENPDDDELACPCFYSKGKAYPWPYAYPSIADMEAMSDSDEDTTETNAFDNPLVFLKRVEEDGFVPKCFVETLSNHKCCSCCPMHCCATSWISIESLTV